VRRSALVVAVAVVVSLAAAAPSHASARLIAFSQDVNFPGVRPGTARSLAVDVAGRVRERRVAAPTLSFRLTARQLAKLRAAVRAAPLSGLRPSYVPPPTLVVVDGGSVTVTRNGRSVRVAAGAAHVPRRLTRLLSALTALIR
jgi:hypothetical protein